MTDVEGTLLTAEIGMTDVEGTLLTAEIGMTDVEGTLLTAEIGMTDVEGTELKPEVIVEDDGDSDWETIYDSEEEEIEEVGEEIEEVGEEIEEVGEEIEEAEEEIEEVGEKIEEAEEEIEEMNEEIEEMNEEIEEMNEEIDAEQCCKFVLCSYWGGSESESDSEPESENSLLLPHDNVDEIEDAWLKCPPDYDSDIGDEMEKRLADAGRKNFVKCDQDVQDGYPEVLDDEQCLLEETKPWQNDPNLASDYNIQNYEEIDTGQWLKLNKLICDCNGYGILNWFQYMQRSRHVRQCSQSAMYAVSLAAEVGSTAIFDFLLGESFSIAKDRHPLHECAIRGQFIFISHMLKMGFDVDVTDSSGASALHVLAKQREDTSQMMNFLLTRGADVNKTDSHGCSPLYFAVSKGATSNVITLIEAGASLDVSKGKETILYTAINRSLKMTVIIHRARIHQRIFETDVLLKLVGKTDLVQPTRFLLRCNVQCNTDLLKGKSLIAHASANGGVPSRMQMVDLLYKAGYKMNKGEKHVRDASRKCPMGRILRKIYHRNLTRPKSLLMLATFKIRNLLGPCLPISVHQLPLPPSLKDVLQLKHI